MQSIGMDELPALLTPSTVFLYPTDTIYGLGGLVTPQVREKIRAIKQRDPQKPFSIIVPSFQRIQENFEVSNEIEKEWAGYKQKFPGRGLTFLLPLKEKGSSTTDFSLLSSSSCIGVRLIDHPFQEQVTEIGQPWITTSANLSGQPNITHPSQLTNEQLQLIDYIIDEGTIDAPASVIIDYMTQAIIRG